MIGKIKRIWNIVKNKFLENSDKLINIFGISLISFIAYQAVGHNKFMELSKVWGWPVFLLLVLINFKKVIAYLFFSLEEYKFFGTGGKLKDIRALIDEKAEQKYQDKLDNEARGFEIGNLKKELEENNKDLDKVTKLANEALDLAKDYSKVVNEKDVKIQELQSINSNLIKNVEEDSFESPWPRRGSFVNKDGTVYFVGEDKLYIVPDMDTFSSWGAHFSHIHPINSLERALPDGGSLPARREGYRNPLDQIKEEEIINHS